MPAQYQVTPPHDPTDWRKKNRYYHDLIEHQLTFYSSEMDSLLVLGCGTGEIFDAASSRSCVGVDVRPDVIRRARERLQGRANVECYQVKDYASLPELNRTFDIVILYDVLAELHDIQAVLDALRPMMTTRTRLVMNFHSHLWSPLLRMAERLGLKRPAGKATWVTMDDALNFLALSDYELVTKEPCMVLPKKLFGVGPLLNRWIAPLPLIKNFCLENIVVARLRGLPLKEAAPSVTVVVPARNEAGNIEAVVRRLPSMGKQTELIFVEGHSTDRTWEEIRRVQGAYPDRDIKVLQQPGRGKADAVRCGFAEAGGDLLMILDADLTVAPEDLVKFYKAVVENKGEFVNGCRLVYPVEKQAMQFLNMVANKLFGWLFTWLLGQRYRDTLCGTKVLWKADYQRIVAGRGFFGDDDPFGDFDLIFGAARLGLKSIEVPIRYQERTYGETNIRRFLHGMLLLRMSLLAARRLKFKRFF